MRKIYNVKEFCELMQKLYNHCKVQYYITDICPLFSTLWQRIETERLIFNLPTNLREVTNPVNQRVLDAACGIFRAEASARSRRPAIYQSKFPISRTLLMYYVHIYEK